MDAQQYSKETAKTWSNDYDAIRSRFRGRIIDLDHCQEGICGEAGEFTDAIKKHIYYGAELDCLNNSKLKKV